MSEINKLNELKENLIKKGYIANVFSNTLEAKEYLLKTITNKIVGIGGSTTIDQLNIYDDLSRNNTVYWHWKQDGVQTKAREADVYLSSVNAVSIDGQIINIDANCNRVASTLYGHEKVYFIIGRNKLADNLDDAIYRARNIAAPLNAKRLNKKTPCVKDLKCHNCTSPERICKALVVLYEKVNKANHEVILIDEDLGY